MKTVKAMKTMRSKRTADDSYEVYDAEGKSVGRVVFPVRRPVIDRATRATVYLQRRPAPRSGGPRAA